MTYRTGSTLAQSTVWTLALALLVLGSARASVKTSSTQESKETTQTEPTTTEERILRELEQLRNELRALSTELGQLRRAVNDIHRVAVRPPVPPPPDRVSLDDDAVLGSPEAEIAIVEFSDYQCPYCERFHRDTFPRLKETYIDTGKVRYIFRDFPLKQIHPKAMEAAVAANCGGKQGKYWEMHHGLFVNQSRLGPDLYEELAASFDLNLGAFQACLDSPAEKQEIDGDLAYGQEVGVRGTPHYFLGRVEGDQLVEVKRLSGAQPFQAFSRLIDALLQ